jgi:hypothetical protein
MNTFTSRLYYVLACFHHLRCGLQSGFPLCCVLQFVFELDVLGWLPFERRGVVCGAVPCFFHVHRLTPKSLC